MKPIDGWKGKYSISNSGVVTNSAGTQIKPWASADGYLRVSLYEFGKKQNEYIHILVARHFLPKPTREQTQVDHINRKRQDNRATNLRWVTPLENSANRSF